MTTLDRLNQKLAAVEQKLSEVKDRLPAHSVKPTIMNELIDLEDERDRLLAEIADLVAGNTASGNA